MEHLGSADFIHSEDRSARIKCFGRQQRVIHIGDQVTLHHNIQYSEPEFIAELVRTGQILSDDGAIVVAGLPSPITTFDVATTLGYIHGRDSTFVAWDDHRETAAPLFDYQGRPEGGPGWYPTFAGDMGTCDRCEATENHGVEGSP